MFAKVRSSLYRRSPEAMSLSSPSTNLPLRPVPMKRSSTFPRRAPTSVLVLLDS